MIYGFESYTLDTDRYELRCAGAVCPLEPQAMDILIYLLQHRDRVVTKHELLDGLWPDRVVGEGILAQRLMTIRKAIGDSGRSQHCIKTLHGRGYRFAAAVQVQPAATGFVPSSVSSSHRADLSGPYAQVRTSLSSASLFNRPAHFLGREAELTELARWWSAAQQGARQFGFVVGEPGIGKTALVDAFVTQAAAAHDVTVGRGQCVEDYGTGEPYLPMLEALGRLCRGTDAEHFVSHLRRYAPSWLAHLPSVDFVDSERPIRTIQGVTPTQMLRELTDALESLTRERSLLLVLEDLHWSDRATLTWLAYMARRRDPARILILGTCRPVEAADHAHPLRVLRTALRPSSVCVEISLEALPGPAVADYLSQRWTADLPTGLHRLLHCRTGGHPLFMVAMVDELLREKRLDATPAAAGDAYDVAAVEALVPANLREYIEQHLDQLPDEDQLLLEAASAAGSTFAIAAASAGVDRAAETVEARYATLARQGRFICPSGTETWPDGTISSCYAFKHALYHDVVYARVPAGRRMRLHQQIGARRELGYGAQAATIAAELAVHFVRGNDAGRAVHYLCEAAHNAVRRSAYQEAIALVAQGMELLRRLAQPADHARVELRLLTALGLALVATKGQAHPEVETAYARARSLCERLEDPAQLFFVLDGLFSYYVVRAELDAAVEVAEQRAALAQRLPDTMSQLVAHCAIGQMSLFRGAMAAARVHLQQGIALYDPAEHHGMNVHVGFPGDLGVFCRCFDAHALWHLGYPDQAAHRMDEAIALAKQLGHPFSQVLSLAYATMLYQFRRDTSRAKDAAEAALAICKEQGFAYYLAWVTILRGWALTAEMSTAADGVAQMHSGLSAIRATGAKLRQPYYLALLADACDRRGETELGLTLLTEALAESDRRGERWQEPELHRLRGELLARGAESDEAQACLHRALALARAQESRSLELRAAVGLARWLQRQGKPAESTALLAPIYDWFTEGFGTADLQEAKALLDELG